MNTRVEKSLNYFNEYTDYLQKSSTKVILSLWHLYLPECLVSKKILKPMVIIQKLWVQISAKVQASSEYLTKINNLASGQAYHAILNSIFYVFHIDFRR